MSYLGFARKYRPQKFSEVVGQEIVVKILENSLKKGKLSHAYIFSGPKGVGKTSTARILAKALNCTNPQNKPCDQCPSCIAVKEGMAMSVIEMDAASHTSVENIRDLRETVRYSSAQGFYKVYIIDEAHMLSQSAFNAFLKTLEEPPPHVVFVLATTEPRKIPLTVLSRCQHLQFRRIPVSVIKERLKTICSIEGINATDEALYAIAVNSEGSMRDALMLLDQITSFTENITQQDVNLLTGETDIKILYELADSLIDGNREKIILLVEELNNTGTDFKLLTKDLIHFLRNSLIAKITKSSLHLSETLTREIQNLNRKTSEEHLVLLIKDLINSEPAIKSSFFPRIAFEITLLKLSMLSNFKRIDDVIKDFKKIPEQAPPAEESTESLFHGWLSFLQKVETENPLLAMKIKHAEVKFKEGQINLIYNGGASLYVESVRESISEIQNLLKEFFPDVKITVQEKQNTKKEDTGQEMLDHPLVKKALQLFEGRILSIIPKKGGNDV